MAPLQRDKAADSPPSTFREDQHDLQLHPDTTKASTQSALTSGARWSIVVTSLH